jgi:hypothetical protein
MSSFDVSPNNARNSSTSDLDVIRAFVTDTTYKELVHELGQKTPTNASKLLDITTNLAFSKEAVRVIFPR